MMYFLNPGGRGLPPMRWCGQDHRLHRRAGGDWKDRCGIAGHTSRKYDIAGFAHETIGEERAMTHDLGRVVNVNLTVTDTSPLDFTPGPGPLGGPRFVILHFDNVNLKDGAELTVDLGYTMDVFRAGDGTDFWTRPADPSSGPIKIRITGGTGSAQINKYGSGEPAIPPGQMPGTTIGSQSNPDVFFQTNPYQEPIYETRLECNPGFLWQNAACTLPPITDAIRQKVAASVGIIVEVDSTEVSSCSGTLIAPDLFLTARHCLTDPNGEDIRSASVTFDYQTDCPSNKVAGSRFFKVIGEVATGVAPDGTENIATADDWVVVRLDAAPGELPPPLDIRDSMLMNGESIFTMHHPNGAVKKTQTNSYSGDGTASNILNFDYAGGSSGSSLFDSAGRIVGGPLHAGFGCSVTYAPIGNVKNALANPPGHPAPIDVMIVFDKSGSMSDPAPPINRTKLQEAQDAASLFVQLIRVGADDRLGLVTFSSGAHTDRTPIDVATAQPALVGPAPFTSGLIGGITTGGSTSIGKGLQLAIAAYGASANERAILLMTDGLQNTSPFVADVEGSLGATKVNAIGFGSDADIDGPLLTRIAHEHHGQFTRAIDGLSLRKFFGLSFGNIFEAGAITDPNYILRASQRESDPHKFDVCGEERITVVIGWDSPSTPLMAEIFTPSGKPIDAKASTAERGLTWAFWRIPLPHEGERDGTWQVKIARVPGHGEFQPEPTDVRYFFLVVCAGGPKLLPLPPPKRVYTGDPIDPRVGLHYRNRTTPRDAKVQLTIEAPRVALGQLVTNTGLQPPQPAADALDAFHATLQAIAKKNGGVLPVDPTTINLPLYDDGFHDDGAFEPDGIFNNRLKDLTRVEGTYHFHAVATYGDKCHARREAIWSLHVEPGIDPGRSTVTVVDVTGGPGGNHGTVVITPRDPYGNPLGPGRGGGFTVSSMPGVQLVGPVKDNGDGSYGISVIWDPTVTGTPGVVVQQPGRNPVPLTPPSAQPIPPAGPHDCSDAAGKLLDCLGLPDPDVACVRVTKVSVEIDLKDSVCCDDGKKKKGKDKDCGCK
jgi:hypothetical protein